jgi:hypothetical protein
VASVVVGPAAAADLAELILTHSLPQDTPERVPRVLARLETFPDMGQRLSGRWEGTRHVVGPWPWMLVVYEHHPELDRADADDSGRPRLDGRDVQRTLNTSATHGDKRSGHFSPGPTPRAPGVEPRQRVEGSPKPPSTLRWLAL